MDSCTNTPFKLLYIDTELHKLIHSVKKVSQYATWSEVIDALKEYITKKNLFDFKEMKVHCENDDLEALFGVSEFTILDIKDLLKRLVFPVREGKDCVEEIVAAHTPPSVTDLSLKQQSEEGKAVEEKVSVTGLPLKRKGEEDTFEAIQAKREREKIFEPDSSTPTPFTGECSFLQIPDSPRNESETESDSVCSIQCYETSFVHDTSDDSFSHTEYLEEGILTIAETFEIEYEPISEEGESPDLSACNNSSSDSDVEFLHSLSNSVITFISKMDSDEEYYFADDSGDEVGGGSDSSLSYRYDAEISEVDLWKCNQCSSMNAPPNRFCSKCFATRKNWLKNEKTPERRERRKPRSKRKKHKTKKQEPILNENTKSFDLPCTSTKSLFEDISEKSKIMFSESVNKKGICVICCAKPINSSVIHSAIGHSFACYTCAKRLFLKKSRCPICRRTIEKVVYNISA